MLGISFRLATLPEDSTSLAPVTLFPSSFPRKLFDFGKSLQPLVNQLTHKIAYNHQFLSESLQKTIEVDEFTNSLFDIYTKTLKEGLAQNTSLGLIRSDYMMNKQKEGDYDMKQVEVNNISVSFGGLAPAVRDLHKHVLSKYSSIQDLDIRLPENKSAELLADGMIKAFDVYNRPNAVLLIVVESFVVNIFDHRILEFTIAKTRPDIRVLRRTFQELSQSGKLNNNRELIVDGKHEVAVIYYRTAYGPEDFRGQEDWDVRLLMERSKAIKCPSIQYHITGCKKIQQIVSNQSVLEKFIPNERDVKDLMKVFTGLWGLESGPNGDSAVDMALKDPNRFVLKPQREGGGNNYFGNEVAVKLNEIKNSKERESYILMELIKAPKIANHILMPNKSVAQHNFKPLDIVFEFGVFGAIIGDQTQIVHSREAGHNFRSKVFGINEGGVMAGFGALDSPFLY